ncbi:MAG: hypothetical protein WEB00_00690 [Dehalococcoidia bacterium]
MIDQAPDARQRLVADGETHLFCAYCGERLAKCEDKRHPDGSGPYTMTFEPGYRMDPDAAEWVRLKQGRFQGLARGRDVRRRMAVPGNNPVARHVEAAVAGYTSQRKALRVPAPVGTHVAQCRKCGGRSTVVSEAEST